jgi:hypothetical protein
MKTRSHAVTIHPLDDHTEEEEEEQDEDSDETEEEHAGESDNQQVQSVSVQACKVELEKHVRDDNSEIKQAQSRGSKKNEVPYSFQ